MRMKPLPELLLQAQKRNYRALANQSAAAFKFRRSAHRRTDLKPGDVPLNSGEGLRAAYYVEDDPASYSSLKQHISQIDLLFSGVAARHHAGRQTERLRRRQQPPCGRRSWHGPSGRSRGQGRPHCRRQPREPGHLPPGGQLRPEEGHCGCPRLALSLGTCRKASPCCARRRGQTQAPISGHPHAPLRVVVVHLGEDVQVHVVGGDSAATLASRSTGRTCHDRRPHGGCCRRRRRSVCRPA